mmetsp:Transcript_56716/g.182112  ORF Transcript_56716/g.182112 Transcript_56716/m.182112 type:complete len:293 (-) Transcript_56716:509-1387(-)
MLDNQIPRTTSPTLVKQRQAGAPTRLPKHAATHQACEDAQKLCSTGPVWCLANMKTSSKLVQLPGLRGLGGLRALGALGGLGALGCHAQAELLRPPLCSLATEEHREGAHCPRERHGEADVDCHKNDHLLPEIVIGACNQRERRVQVGQDFVGRGEDHEDEETQAVEQRSVGGQRLHERMPLVVGQERSGVHGGHQLEDRGIRQVRLELALHVPLEVSWPEALGELPSPQKHSHVHHELQGEGHEHWPGEDAACGLLLGELLRRCTAGHQEETHGGEERLDCCLPVAQLDAI